MASIRMMMKVMPSPGHGVVDRMVWMDKERPEFANHSIQSELEGYIPSYHTYVNDTSAKFPTLAFNEQMVPVGLSQEKCVYFSWAHVALADRPNEYTDVSGLPTCDLLQLNVHDPHVGVRVHAWVQHELNINCGGKSCVDSCRQARGWWVFSQDRQSGKCYAYDILDTICIQIKHKIDKFGKDQFVYVGGCYHNNATEKYFQGDPGCTYPFQNVTVEVRSNLDPYVATVEVTGENLSFSTSMVNSMQRWASRLSLLFFVAALVTAALFGAGYYYLKGH